MNRPLDIVVLGLSLSSSWGNGHATTYRALLGGVHAAGHKVTFLERDVPWYACHRDMVAPDFCDLVLYKSIDELLARDAGMLAGADAVVIGSYVPDGVELIDAVVDLSPKRLCFYDIDTPVTLAKLAGGDEEYLARRQVPLFDLYFSFSGGSTLDRLRSEFAARRPVALYCAVDLDLYRNTGAPREWDLGYLGTFSRDRQPTLERLLFEPARQLLEMRFVVAGPSYPADMRWPENVVHIEHLPPSEHAEFYSRQRFTLNVTRADMVAAGWSPSVRLFEAAACHTPLISDWWEGIDSFFPSGKAAVIAYDSIDVVAALTNLTEQQRQSYADDARQRVAHAHSAAARATTFIDAIEGVAPETNLATRHSGRRLPA
ncbi:CgeB family protein [Sinorhizobium mexicanum]|uniref:Glycosyltransferase n=1 Tax=Sinorhizobium mexicanum TaxID=375549 RepID=A0A859QS67_9HYPH|nr:glycosyltransferase [Sinorhizobium mexicanum]MBP1884298.1 spore maturation protein CgeB [Sinorhizobium mexicanum]QLL64987.1 glycosyltransferase [Sinorhizobium mexicanum]